MARLTLFITAETEPVYDALDSLQRLHAALARRHGEPFRQLEREIAATLRSLKPADLGHQELSPGTVVLTPPIAWSELIAHGKRLGVL